MGRNKLGLLLAASLCPAQHIQYGSLVNGRAISNPAMDSHGNMLVLTENLALGLCCGVGTGLVRILTRYSRDGSVRELTTTEVVGDTPVFLRVDARDRPYLGVNRDGKPVLIRFGPDHTRERKELVVPFTRLVDMTFAPNGDPVVVGTDVGPTIQIVRLDATTLNPVASRLFTGEQNFPRTMSVYESGAVYIAGAGAEGGAFVRKLSPDFQTILYSRELRGIHFAGATAIRSAGDGSVYVGGHVGNGGGEAAFPTTPGAFQRQLDRWPGFWLSTGSIPIIIGPSAAFVSRLAADGALLASTMLGGSVAEAIDGIALDEEGGVIVHGGAISRDFPATGLFETRCGPDRARSYQSTFVTRLDPMLTRVERSAVAAGVSSRGLPSGPIRGSIFLVLADSRALIDLDRDDPSAVSCNPDAPGSLVTVFATGLGPLDRPVPASGYGDGVTRPAETFSVRTAVLLSTDRIDDVEAVTVPGRTVAVTAVRFRVPDTRSRPLHFTIAPANSTAYYPATNFLYVQ